MGSQHCIGRGTISKTFVKQYYGFPRLYRARGGNFKHTF